MARQRPASPCSVLLWACRQAPPETCPSPSVWACDSGCMVEALAGCRRGHRSCWPCWSGVGGAILSPTIARAESPCTAETEPNDAPGQAATVDGPLCLSGTLPDGDQDLLTWDVSAAEAGERWTVSLTGVPGTTTSLTLLPITSDASVTPVVTGNAVLELDSDPNAIGPVTQADLLVPVGRYVVGVSRSPTTSGEAPAGARLSGRDHRGQCDATHGRYRAERGPEARHPGARCLRPLRGPRRQHRPVRLDDLRSGCRPGVGAGSGRAGRGAPLPGARGPVRHDPDQRRLRCRRSRQPDRPAARSRHVHRGPRARQRRTSSLCPARHRHGYPHRRPGAR